MNQKLKILQISTFDFAGGAERVAWNLFTSYRKLGHDSTLIVGHKFGNDPDVIELGKMATPDQWFRFWSAISKGAGKYAGKIRGADRIRRTALTFAEPGKWLDRIRGHEDFRYPGTWSIPKLSPAPQLIHCHNLHGGYFDLRALPVLSRQMPVLLTLHDAWLMSGHCAHSFDCERWISGCGECPDLEIYPPIEKDGTAFNWSRKEQIYKNCRLYLATPSQWLLNKVQQSMLANSIIESRVIPNGVDISIYSKVDKNTVRQTLGLPLDADIVLLAAYSAHHWKDFETLQSSVKLLNKERKERPLLFLVLGEKTGSENLDSSRMKFIEYQTEPSTLAQYYQAADVYVHASKADTFPNAVLESMACGTPVIATAIGGIPEQIRSLSFESLGSFLKEMKLKHFSPEEATGVLVPPKNPMAICRAVGELLTNRSLLTKIGHNASTDVINRFALSKQVDSYLSWYSEILTRQRFS